MNRFLRISKRAFINNWKTILVIGSIGSIVASAILYFIGASINAGTFIGSYLGSYSVYFNRERKLEKYKS